MTSIRPSTGTISMATRTTSLAKDGYLKMDGSRAPVQCFRRLKEEITDRSGSLELAMRVVLDEPEYHTLYTLRLYDSADRPGHRLSRPEGRPRVVPGEKRTDGFPAGSSRSRATVHSTTERSASGTSSNPTNTRTPSKRSTLQTRPPSFFWTANNPSPYRSGTLSGISQNWNSDRRRRNRPVYPRETVEAVRRTANRSTGKTTRSTGNRSPPPRDGEPDDNVCESGLRPFDNRWLELITRYGFVTTTFPRYPEGNAGIRRQIAGRIGGSLRPAGRIRRLHQVFS